MNIQTISIVVPTKGCVNKCPFCVSRMHESQYENNWNETQMIKRIRYAVMNNVNTCIITGTGEPLQNTHFLNKLSMLFRRMENPFPNIEFQTTGVFLSEIEKPFDNFANSECDPPIYKNIKLLQSLGVNTISLSVGYVFDDEINNKIIGVPEKYKFQLSSLISLLKQKGFNIRLSLNMLKLYDHHSSETILKRCKFLGADQVTFRQMYYDKENPNSEESQWVKENSSNERITAINEYIKGKTVTHYIDIDGVYTSETKGEGEFLYYLPFGPGVYSIMEMGIVIDDDCMSKETNETLKYIILRENGKLYCRWDDEGSLIF